MKKKTSKKDLSFFISQNVKERMQNFLFCAAKVRTIFGKNKFF